MKNGMVIVALVAISVSGCVCAVAILFGSLMISKRGDHVSLEARNDGTISRSAK